MYIKKIIITIGILILAAVSVFAQNVQVTNATTNPVPVSATNTAAAPVITRDSNAYPSGATAKTGASGNVAAASAAASLAAVSAKTNYVTGFTCTAAGATAGLPVNVTLTGLITGTQTYTFVFPAGVLVGAQPLVVTFPVPIPASAVNTAITVTLPSGGAGNTNASSNIQGYDL